MRSERKLADRLQDDVQAKVYLPEAGFLEWRGPRAHGLIQVSLYPRIRQHSFRNSAPLRNPLGHLLISYPEITFSTSSSLFIRSRNFSDREIKVAVLRATAAYGYCNWMFETQDPVVLRLPLPRDQRRLQIRHDERHESGADEDRTGAAGGAQQVDDAGADQQKTTQVDVARCCGIAAVSKEVHQVDLGH